MPRKEYPVAQGISFTQEDFETLGHVFLKNRVEGAVLLVRLEDGTQGRMTFLPKKIGEPDPSDEEKNAFGKAVLQIALDSLERGDFRTVFRGRTTPEQ